MVFSMFKLTVEVLELFSSGGRSALVEGWQSGDDEVPVEDRGGLPMCEPASQCASQSKTCEPASQRASQSKTCEPVNLSN